MNSVSNHSSRFVMLRQLSCVALLFASVALPGSAFAQETQPVGPIGTMPPPAAAPAQAPAPAEPSPALAPAAEAAAAEAKPTADANSAAVSDTPTPLSTAEEDAAETADADANAPETPPSSAELVDMLRSGNKPLTISQMSAVKDMIRRMEMMAEIERKMNELSPDGATAGANLGTPRGGRRPGGSAMPGMSGSGGDVRVLRIMGASGKYVATLAVGNNQMLVREGDVLDMGVIRRISIDGVVVAGNDGNQTLPFVAPAGIANINTSR